MVVQTPIVDCHYGNLDITNVESTVDFVQLQLADISLQALSKLVEDPPFCPWSLLLLYER